MASLRQVVYLSKADYTTLLTNGTITKNGKTVIYNENNLYVTPEEDKVLTGTSSEWQENSTLIPLLGQLIFYTDLNSIKIGDGTSTLANLSFIAAEKVAHPLIFGNNNYVYDGSAEVTIPLYDGTTL